VDIQFNHWLSACFGLVVAECGCECTDPKTSKFDEQRRQQQSQSQRQRYAANGQGVRPVAAPERSISSALRQE